MPDTRIHSASHPVTNEVMFRLITERLTPESRAVDFGAGKGAMSQRVGEWFEARGVDPAARLTPLEIQPREFRYGKVACRAIDGDSRIPLPDRSQDVVWAIEVIEHLPRPYDFLLEAARVLRPGGYLLFSLPNLLHMESRLRFLLTGSCTFFAPPSAAPANAGRICGHIMPLALPQLDYGLRRSGFVDIEYRADRAKRSSAALWWLGLPVLVLGTRLADRASRAYDPTVWSETRHLTLRLNRQDIATSRSVIGIARMPTGSEAAG